MEPGGRRVGIHCARPLGAPRSRTARNLRFDLFTRANMLPGLAGESFATERGSGCCHCDVSKRRAHGKGGEIVRRAAFAAAGSVGMPCFIHPFIDKTDRADTPDRESCLRAVR